uniref:Interleukin-1 receptor-associated kinase 1-like n=1 Tax=Callorhinchus milii TaxID=7868 RepID=A0A4W3GCV5_CALMI
PPPHPPPCSAAGKAKGVSLSLSLPGRERIIHSTAVCGGCRCAQIGCCVHPQNTRSLLFEANPVNSICDLRFVYRHPNIVELAGCCVEGDIYCLVYVYMANGSLEDRLQCQNNTPALPWLRRLDIALGAARAIQFLHSSNPSLIHGDVKSSNILLDENLSAKLGDFGLARFSRLSGNTGRSCTVARTQTLQGTLAYLPNEYIQSGQLAPELDTYSFGVVSECVCLYLYRCVCVCVSLIKEMVEEDDGETSGTDSQSFAANLCLRHLDRKPGQCVSEVLLQLCVLACECLNRRRRRRPKMTTVIKPLAYKSLHPRTSLSLAPAPPSIVCLWPPAPPLSPPLNHGRAYSHQTVTPPHSPLFRSHLRIFLFYCAYSHPLSLSLSLSLPNLPLLSVLHVNASELLLLVCGVL